mmetsp:Transcript_7541/g.21013  ORF Transcript_7541/g.21013 Transcript_7541/m.21013 type:complete len:141 (-) Transcript_7541:860-1282(-)
MKMRGLQIANYIERGKLCKLNDEEKILICTKQRQVTDKTKWQIQNYYLSFGVVLDLRKKMLNRHQRSFMHKKEDLNVSIELLWVLVVSVGFPKVPVLTLPLSTVSSHPISGRRSRERGRRRFRWTRGMFASASKRERASR